MKRDSSKKSAQKALTWRCIASSDTFILALTLSMFFDGVALAGAIALAEIPTKLVIYFVHERAWAFFTARRGLS